jgi:hypothetical protein
MSEVRLVPRFLALPALALLIAGCAVRPDPGPNPLRANPCATGRAPVSKQAPIVCVDDSARTLVVFPDPVVVHNVKESDRTTPVTVQWLTRSGTGDVQVLIEPGCLDKKSCDGRGKCKAETVPGAKRQCKYDVWITGGGHDRLDPEVQIEPCC